MHAPLLPQGTRTALIVNRRLVIMHNLNNTTTNNYSDKGSNYSFSETAAAPMLLMILSFITLLLRGWVKGKMLKRFTVDDILLLISFLLYSALCILAICAASYGFGVHSIYLSDEDLYVIYYVRRFVLCLFSTLTFL